MGAQIIKYCKNCGKEITEDTKYCPHCGRLITGGDEKYSNYYVISNRVYLLWGWVFSILALFIPFLGFISITFSIYMLNNKKTNRIEIAMIIVSIVCIVLGMMVFSEGFFG